MIQESLFVGHAEQKFDSRSLRYSYFLTLFPGEMKVEVSKEFYSEVVKRMAAGKTSTIEMVLR